MKYLILLSVFALAVLFIPQADAATPQYGIALSRTCLSMISNGISSDCPTYQEINTLFPDTTNPAIAGDFKIIDGIYQRDIPPVKNPWRFYYYSTEPILWVDPPSDARSRLIMITIESSLPEYKSGDESKKMDDYSISFQKDRWVDEKCHEAKVTSKTWVFLTGDTLNLMKHSCDKAFTSFDSTVKKEFVKSYQDISTSYKYKHDLWIKENLIKCKIKGC